MKLFFTVCFTAACAIPAMAQDQAGKVFEAIRNNDLSAVKVQIAGGDFNAKDKRGTTALMSAAAYGSVDAVKALIDAGAGVNAKNAFDATALIWAVNDIEKVRLLLAKGADVNAKSKMGRSPLLVAASDDRGAPVVELLLAKGAQEDGRASTETPAHLQPAHGTIAPRLTAKDASATPTTEGGLKPLC